MNKYSRQAYFCRKCITGNKKRDNNRIILLKNAKLFVDSTICAL